MAEFERLTVAQATVRFLQTQYSEFDGKRQRLIGGLSGRVEGPRKRGQHEPSRRENKATNSLFFQPKDEQAMVHAAMGFAKARNRLATMACSTSDRVPALPTC